MIHCVTSTQIGFMLSVTCMSTCLFCYIACSSVFFTSFPLWRLISHNNSMHIQCPGKAILETHWPIHAKHLFNVCFLHFLNFFLSWTINFKLFEQRYFLLGDYLHFISHLRYGVGLALPFLGPEEVVQILFGPTGKKHVDLTTFTDLGYLDTLPPCSRPYQIMFFLNLPRKPSV